MRLGQVEITFSDDTFPDESNLSWVTTSLMAAALLVISFLVAILGYTRIVKKHFPNLLPKQDLNNRSKTRYLSLTNQGQCNDLN